MNRSYIFLFSIVLFCVSCKKEDTFFPDITIRSPQKGAVFSVGEEIPFNIVVEDNEIVQYVRISLLSEDNKAVMPSIIYYPGIKQAVIEGVFPLDDLSLPSGNYYLKMYVGDGNNETSAAILIIINGVPVTNLGLFVVTETTSEEVIIYHLDTTGQIHTWLALNNDHLEACLDNENHQLYVIPKSKGKLRAISTKDAGTQWSVDRNASQSPYWFQGAELINQELYTGDYNGWMKTYDKWGYLTRSVNLEENYIPQNFLRHGYYTYVHLTPLQLGRQKRIYIYNYGFKLIQNIIFHDELIDWFGNEDESAILFHNNAEGIAISFLYYFYGHIQQKRIIFGEVLRDVQRISKTHFLLATDQGIWLYNLTTNTPFRILSGNDYVSLSYNEITGLAAAGTQKEVHVFSYPDGAIISRFSFPYDIKKIFWYNSK